MSGGQGSISVALRRRLRRCASATAPKATAPARGAKGARAPWRATGAAAGTGDTGAMAGLDLGEIMVVNYGLEWLITTNKLMATPEPLVTWDCPKLANVVLKAMGMLGSWRP